MAADPEKQVGPLPSALARRYVLYVGGFGLAVGFGLAPFLGKIPGLDALLTIFPESLRSFLIPLSFFLMGVVALVIQFYSGETLSRTLLRKRFLWSLIALLIGFAMLLTLVNFLVIPFSIDHGGKTVHVLISFSRTTACPCPRSDSDSSCLRKISLNPVKIEDCWGSGAIQRSRLLLSLCYLFVIVDFGALIGLLLLQEDAKKKQQRRPRKTAAAPKTPDSTPPQGTS
jgi:hypothetical protein